MLLFMLAARSHCDRARQRGQARSDAIRLFGTLATAAGALILAGCGATAHGRTPQGSSASQAAASASVPSTAASQSATQSSVSGCQQVPAPAPRTGERAPQPTLHLDPSKTYTVTLLTNCGTIKIELDAKRAPKTAASFASLVERGFYNDLTFHRVVPNFVIQGGDPNGNGTGGPGYHVVEAPPSDLQYTKGVVAMAKAADEPSGASGSQFFIVTATNAGLPPDYALVGHVVEGDTPWMRSRAPRAKAPTTKTARRVSPSSSKRRRFASS